METKTLTDSRLQSLLAQYDMHTTYFNNVLEGISDEDAHQRLQTKANHIAWIAGSLVQERFELANTFGIEGHQQANSLFENYQGIKDQETYPPLSQYKEDWENISLPLKDALHDATREKLDTFFEMMPGQNMTYYDLVVFMMHREAYLIGQIGLWRRLLGYEAMKYQ